MKYFKSVKALMVVLSLIQVALIGVEVWAGSVPGAVFVTLMALITWANTAFVFAL